MNNFTLNIPQNSFRNLAIGWLLLAISSLIIGGLLTILIVLSRTPIFQDIIPWTDFFHTAIVVHVDLTVLVWFLAFAGLLWSLMTSRCLFCGKIALLLAAIGTLIISSAPFLGDGNPLMNNYIPVLQMPIFFIGLGIFALGFSILVIHSLLSYITSKNSKTVLEFGLFTGLVTALIAIIAFIWSYFGIPKDIEIGQYYYELLFWGGGHILQFTHTQLMLVLWLWLATVSGVKLSITPRLAIILLALGMAPTLLTPLIYLTHNVNSPESLTAFTDLMKYGGGIAALPLGLIIVLDVIRAALPSLKPERSALIISIFFFAVGGIIGFLIHSSNVTIPAHYHASIFAITIAFMGITYHLMPKLGFKEITSKWATWQPIIYGAGQLMHVLGFAWSGGYGVQRKTAGAEQGLEGMQQVAMGIMGLGGMIAIIGGVIFLMLVLMAMRK
ncbi:cbb3-type cytochrome c oxidase subunit I [Candidatus Halobeggiatoa sp. HSG11]|nr:cbb3-type cytochrome c oxidase subunit I [Candidatus Halobeggiatoa sp. HSG11]